MAHAAASWLVTVLPMLDAGAPPEELTRSGSEHRQFVPSNAYPTKDGFLYLAIGSDRQWAAFAALPCFASLREPRFERNQGRKDARRELHERIAELTARRSTDENLADLRAAVLVCAPIHTVAQVAKLPWLAGALRRTVAPDGRTVRLPPAPVGRTAAPEAEPFAPRQGEHTARVLGEAGFSEAEVAALFAEGAARGAGERSP